MLHLAYQLPRSRRVWANSRARVGIQKEGTNHRRKKKKKRGEERDREGGGGLRKKKGIYERRERVAVRSNGEIPVIRSSNDGEGPQFPGR